jgi:hypothetical protein
MNLLKSFNQLSYICDENYKDPHSIYNVFSYHQVLIFLELLILIFVTKILKFES